jgi:ParE toxin of type II toxin-antitoxin system, parDE
MSDKIVFRDKALKELYQAFWWYEDRKEGLGELFFDEINSCLVVLKTNANSFQLKYKKFHQLPIKKFPYVILYKIYSSEIVIYGVFHTSRNPKLKYKP